MINMNITQNKRCIYEYKWVKNTIWVFEHPENELELQRQMTLKLYHESRNTLSNDTQSMILFYELRIISYIISTLSTLSQLFPDTYQSWAHQGFSHSAEKYSYDVEYDTYSQFFSSVICSINHVLIPTENVSLLTLSLWSKSIFEFLH